MNYYKVVEKQGNCLWSCVIGRQSKYVRQYRLGEKVDAEPGSKLFVFGDLDSAMKFAQDDFRLAIYRVEVINPIPLHFILDVCYLVDDLLLNFWGHKTVGQDILIDAPPMTYGCDSVELLELI